MSMRFKKKKSKRQGQVMKGSKVKKGGKKAAS